MTEEKKPDTAQPTGQPKPEDQKPEDKKPEVGAASGLDSFTPDQLKALYAKSPELFEGIAPKPEAKKTEEKKPEPEPKPGSAAPPVSKIKVGDGEVTLPGDVPVDMEMVERFAKQAEELGITAKQFQAQVDQQAKEYRAEIAKQQIVPAKKTPAQLQQEQDAQNVTKLKSDKEFGKDYDKNMEIARRAAVKLNDPETLERLKTSDPVLVKMLWHLGMSDAEPVTLNGTPRTGDENKNEEEAKGKGLQQRYNRSPEMFKGEGGTQSTE